MFKMYNKISTKLTLMSAVFSLPILILLYFMINGFNSDIQFSTLELYGNRYQKPLERLLQTIPIHYKTIKDQLIKSKVREDDLEKITEEIDQIFTELEQVNTKIGADLQFTENGLSLRNRKHLQIFHNLS